MAHFTTTFANPDSLGMTIHLSFKNDNTLSILDTRERIAAYVYENSVTIEDDPELCKCQNITNYTESETLNSWFDFVWDQLQNKMMEFIGEDFLIKYVP